MKFRFKKRYTILPIIIFTLGLSILVSSEYLNRNNRAKEYRIGTIGGYDIYLVNDNYIISGFSGSGGWLYGGIIGKEKFHYSETLQEAAIDRFLDDGSVYRFKGCSYPDNGRIYIGNYDSDKNIEIFFYEPAGSSFEYPVEITEDGSIKKDTFLTNPLFVPSIFINMLLILLLFIIFSCIVLLCIFLTADIRNRRKGGTVCCKKNP